MSDLYDQRIDAMKARERGSPRFPDIIKGQWWWRAFREPACNIERLAAYKRKRARYDRDMYIVEEAMEEVYDT